MSTLLTTNELAYLMPEMIILFTACAVMVLHLFVNTETPKAVLNFSYRLTQFGIVVATVVTMYSYDTPVQHLFSQHYLHDNFSVLLKVSILLIAMLVMLYSKEYLVYHQIPSGEYFALALFSILGMMLLVSASSLVMIYLGLELLSLPLYALVALQRDSLRVPEAGMKYFVLGALASGMILYGMSLIYGITGTLIHHSIFQTIAQMTDPTALMVVGLGLVFMLVAMSFKLGVAPFHMWVPDIYDGAPASVTLFIATLPKIAAFGMVIRVLTEALPSLNVHWEPMLLGIGILSVVLGNFIAIAQTNLKRLLAYSAIAHMGFMLLGIAAGDDAGYSAALFYIITYALTSAGMFGMVIIMSGTGYEADRITDLRGMNLRNPWCALVIMILVFSMVGVPPAVGFYGKLAVLQAIIDKGHMTVATIAVLASVVGGFYYLRLLKFMYFDQPEDPVRVAIRPVMQLGIGINGVLVIALGVFPSVLFFYCTKVFFQ